MQFLKSDEIRNSQKIATLFAFARDFKEKISLSVSTLNGTLESNEIYFDESESAPTIFFIKHPIGTGVELMSFANVILRIFRSSYSFKTEIIETFEENGTKISIVNVPGELKPLKERLRRRVKIKDRTLNSALELSHVKISPAEMGPLDLISVSSDSIELQNKLGAVYPDIINLEDQSVSISLSKSKTTTGSIVYTSKFETPIHSFKFLIFFSEFLFPTLEERKEPQFEELIRLYSKLGFLERYIPANVDRTVFKNDLFKVWTSYSNNKTNTAFDITSKSDNELVGASSVVRSFKDIHNKDIFVMTQMCVLDDPKNFQSTLDLYTWRPEFILNIPGELRVCCWYDGASKWLSRIWTTFSIEVQKEFQKRVIYDISTYSVPVKGALAQPQDRIYYAVDNTIAGAFPSTLNIAGLFDHIFQDPPEVSVESMKDSLSSFIRANSNLPASIRLTMAQNEIPENDWVKTAFSKFCLFDKDHLSLLAEAFEIVIEKSKRNLKNQTIKGDPHVA